MNIKPIVQDFFYNEWASLKDYTSLNQAEDDFSHVSWDHIFNFKAIQAVVDRDVKGRAGHPKEVVERYHRRNLRFLSETYANEVYLDFTKSRPQKSMPLAAVNEDQLRDALQRLKIAWNCPIYPCQA